MNSEIDVTQLAVDRSNASARISTKRRWISRYVLPATIFLAFVALIAWAAKDSLLPSKPVTVVPVVVAKAEVQQAGTPMFQAAGWIEPRPAAVVVSSLAPGVIAELLVVEGDAVKRGQPVARLIDADARLQRDQAIAEKELREADVEAAKAELDSAHLAIDKPIQLMADLAEARSISAKVEAELESLPTSIDAARKLQTLAEQNLAKKRQVADAIPATLVRQAEAELTSSKAELAKLKGRQPILEKQFNALQFRVQVLEERLDLKLEERRRLASAKASLKAAEARLTKANLAIDAANLLLSRMTVIAPIDGRVLSIHATAGMRLAGLDPHSEKGASAIVTLYDPMKLQVRVDVRLEDLQSIKTAQRARIETASLSEALGGEVIAVTSFADIQKNTLQVKVAIDSPPDLIRPEMLAQVTFLAPEKKQQASDLEKLRVLVPRQLVNGNPENASVWIANLQNNTAQRRSVKLGAAGTNELVEVVSGLEPTDKLISSGREALAVGNRIRITSEDQVIGIR